MRKMRTQQWELAELVKGVLKLMSLDSEVMQRMAVLGDSIRQHRDLDRLNGYHSHYHGRALEQAHVPKELRERMRYVKRAGDAARHAPFDAAGASEGRRRTRASGRARPAGSKPEVLQVKVPTLPRRGRRERPDVQQERGPEKEPKKQLRAEAADRLLEDPGRLEEQLGENARPLKEQGLEKEPETQLEEETANATGWQNFLEEEARELQPKDTAQHFEKEPEKQLKAGTRTLHTEAPGTQRSAPPEEQQEALPGNVEGEAGGAGRALPQRSGQPPVEREAGAAACLHGRVRRWANAYGNGAQCRDCGAELLRMGSAREQGARLRGGR